jgi:acyl carrier protein
MGMTREAVLKGIAQVARTHLDWEGVLDENMRLVEDLELDSIKALTLALELENHFRVCLPQDAEIVTVGDLVANIRGALDG